MGRRSFGLLKTQLPMEGRGGCGDKVSSNSFVPKKFSALKVRFLEMEKKLQGLKELGWSNTMMYMSMALP